jgi:hypothetical protein
MGLRFRALRADEIECRIGQIAKNGNGLTLLLYKDSRTDRDILDETVGPEGWECYYDIIGGELFCTVAIWSEERQRWVSKQDVGTPSNMEAEKGRASDAFKRACFRWGIGVELYTAPRIWVPSNACTIKQGNNGKYVCYDTFTVEQVEIKDGKITSLTIRNENTGKAVFTTAQQSKARASKPDGALTIEQSAEIAGLVERLAEKRGVDKDIVLSSLMKSKAVIMAGADGEIKTSNQADAAISQLKTWMRKV